MPDSILKSPDLVTPYVDQVRQLADSHRRELAFLPKGVYVESAARGNLWVAIDDRSEMRGYLLLGGQHPRTKVFHLCTHADHRESGVGQALVSELVKYTTDSGWHRITARVYAHLRANRFWQRVGFHIIDRVPGKSPGTTINVYARELEIPSLFSASPREITIPIAPRSPLLQTPSYVIDLNVVFDAIRNRDNGQCAQIIASALRHELFLNLTPEGERELERSSRDQQNDPVLAFARNLPTVPEVSSDVRQRIVIGLKQLLRPGCSHLHQWKRNDESDLAHLAYSIHHGVFGFITSDADILKNAKIIYEQYRLTIVSPNDFVDDFEPNRSAIRSPMLVSSPFSEIGVTTVNSNNRVRVDEFLLNHDKRKRPLLAWPSATSPPVVVSSGDQIVGVGIRPGSRSSVDDTVLYLFVDETHRDADRAIDHMLVDSANIGETGRVWRFNLRIPRNQIRTRDTAVRRGFHPQIDVGNESEIEFTRIVINGPVLPSDWSRIAEGFHDLAGLGLVGPMARHAELANSGIVLSRGRRGDAWTMPLFDFETSISPGVLIAPDRGAVIVPIDESYANELLPEAQDQKSFVFRHDACFRLERAYFRKVSMLSIAPRGTIIVFYVSGERKCAVALARVTYCQTMTTTQAVLSLMRQGVLSEEELKQRADASGRVAAVTFDNVLAFPKFVGYAELKAMECVSGANLATAQAITHDELRRIVERAFRGYIRCNK